MSFVTQQPHSNSNPSDKYRVVDFESWRDNEEDPQRIKVVSEHDNFQDALLDCFARNATACDL